MKKMIIAVFILAATATITYAKDAKNTEATIAASNEDKTKIDPATLPDAVKATLAGDAYKDWKLNSAWEVKADPVYYTIELKKDDQTTTINIDANGKLKQ